MTGGRGEPCISMASIRVMQQDGRTCPRVELDEENLAAGELALSAIRLGAESALWRLLFETHARDLDKEGRLQLLYRVLEACGDPGVAARVERLRRKPTEGK